MIAKGSKVRFTMPKEVYEMMKPYNPALQQVIEGIAVSDEYALSGSQVVDVEINGALTTVATVDLEVLGV